MNEIFRIRDDEWKVRFGDTVIRYSWLCKGSALACLSLLEKGYAIVTKERGVKYRGHIALDAR